MFNHDNSDSININEPQIQEQKIQTPNVILDDTNEFEQTGSHNYQHNSIIVVNKTVPILQTKMLQTIEGKTTQKDLYMKLKRRRHIYIVSILITRDEDELPQFDQENLKKLIDKLIKARVQATARKVIKSERYGNYIEIQAEVELSNEQDKENLYTQNEWQYNIDEIKYDTIISISKRFKTCESSFSVIGQQIGKGSHGEVFLAVNRFNKKICAIQKMNITEEEIQAIQNYHLVNIGKMNNKAREVLRHMEFKKCSNLKYIVKPIDFWNQKDSQNKDFIFIEMQFCSSIFGIDSNPDLSAGIQLGLNLQEYVKDLSQQSYGIYLRTLMDNQEMNDVAKKSKLRAIILQIILRCILAVKFLHKNEIVHRDIKADNFTVREILVLNNQKVETILQIFICDFGIIGNGNPDCIPTEIVITNQSNNEAFQELLSRSYSCESSNSSSDSSPLTQTNQLLQYKFDITCLGDMLKQLVGEICQQFRFIKQEQSLDDLEQNTFDLTEELQLIQIMRMGKQENTEFQNFDDLEKFSQFIEFFQLIQEYKLIEMYN